MLTKNVQLGIENLPMSQLLAMRPSRRRGLLGVGLTAALVLLLVQIGGSSALPLYDFVEYWAAGRLNVHGENPYDPQRIHELEREAGRDDDAILMWNPPWTLPLVMPLGLLDCHTAHLLWLALLFAAIVTSADALWRLYDGPLAQRWIAWLLALTFLPTLFALKVGQIAPLVLLGAVLFLICLKQGREALAGAATVLLAIKPHLSYLFWIALMFWIVERRRWRVLGGGLLAGVAALAAAALCNPAVLGQYWHTLTSQPPAQYRSPTLGMALRLLLGEEHFRLQFLALVPGLLWLAPYWLRHRRSWDWSARLPMLLLVSLVTAAYGAWLFDLVLLLVPFLQVAAEIRQEGRRGSWLLAAVVYLAFNVVAAAQLACAVEYFAFLWMTPALLLAYVVLRRRLALRLA
jgi:hypothetical protein